MKKLFTLIILFQLGCSLGNSEYGESSNSSKGPQAPIATATLVVDITCPTTSTMGASAQCTAVVDGVATSIQWTVDGAPINSCANQDRCSVPTPTAKAYRVAMRATDELGEFVQSNEATITVAGSGTTTGTIVLTCSASVTVNSTISCSVVKSSNVTSFYYKLNNVAYASCNNLLTCTGNAPSSPTTWTVQAFGSVGGTEISSNVASINITSSSGGGTTPLINISCSSTTPTAGEYVTCEATISPTITLTSGYWMLDTTQLCPNSATCSGAAPAGNHTVYAVGFTASGVRYESNRITLNVR